jgi:phosphatidate phosphatase LPIN
MNDEPVDIHMKLDDHGTAFFVEDVSDAEEESIPPELATSPMPESMLLKAMSEAGEKASRGDSGKNVFDTMEMEPSSSKTSSIAIVNDASKLSAEQTKEDAASTPKATDVSTHKSRRRRKRTKVANSRPSLGGARASLLEHISDENSSESSNDMQMAVGKTEDQERIFDLYDSDNDGDLDEDEDASKEDSGDTPTPTNSVPNASTPIHRQSTASTQDLFRTPEQSEPSLLQARLGNEALDCFLNGPEGLEEASEATEVLTALETNMPSSVPSGRRASTASYFSEPELSPVSSPVDSRSGSPVLSDTEFERRKERNSDSSGEAGAGRWEWGKLPDAPSTDNVKAEKGASKSESEAAAGGDSPTPQDSRKKAWSFSFWRSSSQPPPSKEASNAAKAEEPGIYLDDLKDDEEKISLYLGSKRSPRHSPIPGATTALSVDDDAESGKGSSIPMSPRNRYDSEDDRCR